MSTDPESELIQELREHWPRPGCPQIPTADLVREATRRRRVRHRKTAALAAGLAGVLAVSLIALPNRAPTLHGPVLSLEEDLQWPAPSVLRASRQRRRPASSASFAFGKRVHDDTTSLRQRIARLHSKIRTPEENNT